MTCHLRISWFLTCHAKIFYFRKLILLLHEICDHSTSRSALLTAHFPANTSKKSRSWARFGRIYMEWRNVVFHTSFAIIDVCICSKKQINQIPVLFQDLGGNHESQGHKNNQSPKQKLYRTNFKTSDRIGWMLDLLVPSSEQYHKD